MTKKRKKLNRYDIGGGLNIPGGLMEGIGISKQNIDLSSIKPEQLKIEGLQIPKSSNFNLGNTLGLASTALNAVTTGLNNSNIADTSSLENNIGKVGASAPTVSSTDDVLNAWSNLQHLDHVSWKDIRGGNAGSAATSALGAAASGASAGMAFGPVGSIIGGAIGGIASGIGSLFGRRKAKKKAKELNDKIDIANLTAEANLINASDNVNTQNALTLLANYSAYGGPINMEYTGVMSPFGNRFDDGGPIEYEIWRNSLPDNLKNTNPNEYNLEESYKAGLIPEWNDKDKSYHLPTRNPKTGEILKKPTHPTFLIGLMEDSKLGYYPYMKDGKTYTDTWKANKKADGGWLGTGINENVATAASFLPIVGTIMDGAEFINDPSWENAGWFLSGLASDIFTGGAGRAALKSAKLARKASKAAKVLKERRLNKALERGNRNYSGSMASYRKFREREGVQDRLFRNNLLKVAGYQGADASLNTLQQNLKAFGGNLLTNGAEWDNGITIIGNGGTHEENPYEGVQLGIDNQGIPNLVEEGEVIWNDYVFSNRLAPTKEMKKQNRYRGKTFAEVAKNLQKESEERPNDPISKRGLEDSMSRLALLQEGIRNKSNTSNKFSEGGSKKNSFKSPGIFDWNSTDLSGTIWDENLTKDVSNIMVPDTYNYVLENNNNNKLNNNSQSGKRLNSYLRYAPVLGSVIGLGQSLLSKPDYSSVEKIEGAADKLGSYEPIGYTPIGNYMSYTPFDRNYYINKLNSQASATRRALINQSNGNRATAMAGILAADYNAQEQLGNLARQAEEYNLAQRQRVEEFNRGTNMTNAEMKLKTDMANQELRSKMNSTRLNSIIQAMNMKEAIDANRGASINSNFNTLFENLGNIGREEFTKDMIKNSPFLLYDWMGNYKKTEGKSNENKKSKGGYLTIKKRRK